MGLPIATALFGIFVGAAGVGVLASVLDIPEFSLILCAMIGLGVGIDYPLFIVPRHRPHLHEGLGVEAAAGTAVATAGQAVDRQSTRLNSSPYCAARMPSSA